MSASTWAQLRAAAVGIVVGAVLCALIGNGEWRAPLACPPCALPRFDAALAAAPRPAAAAPAAQRPQPQQLPPVVASPCSTSSSASASGSAWVGSVSPLLMHLRCGVESYGMPNILVANGVTGKVVVDVGMNAGEDFTVPGAASGHKVYAFEPVRSKFALVQKALGAIGASHDEYDPTSALRAAAGGQALVAPPASAAAVTMVWAAVGAEAGFVGMKEHPQDGSMDHVRADPSGTVPIVPLSAIIPLDTRIYLLKIDTEGHDGLAIRGAEPWLRTGGVDFVYFEMNPPLMAGVGASAQATLDYLAGFDYACMEASLSAKKEPYLLRSASAAEYIEHRLPWNGKPFYAGSCFTNVLCVHQSWLYMNRTREGGSNGRDQSKSVAELSAQ
jgi:hypothetical protein